MRWERHGCPIWEEKQRGGDRDFSLPRLLGTFCHPYPLQCPQDGHKTEGHSKRLEKKKEEEAKRGRREGGRKEKREIGSYVAMCVKRQEQRERESKVCLPAVLCFVVSQNTVKFVRIKMKPHLLAKKSLVSPMESHWVDKLHSRVDSHGQQQIPA